MSLAVAFAPARSMSGNDEGDRAGPADRPAVRPAASSQEDDRGAGVAAPARIMVVEDDYFIALTIEDALVDEGYAVIAVVTSGEEAIRMAAADLPDLVLMDIRLAGILDGIDTAIALRKRGIPSLFASAHTQASYADRATAAEPLGWITKPFNGTELLEAVRAALAQILRS